MTVIGAALLLAVAVQADGGASAPAIDLQAKCREWLALRLRIEASGARPEAYAAGLAKLLIGGNPSLAASVATPSAPESIGPFEPAVAEQFCREVGHLLDDSTAFEAADLDDGDVESIASLVGVVAPLTPEPRRVPLVAEWRVRKLERTTRIALQQLEEETDQAPERFAKTLQHLDNCVGVIRADVKTAGHDNPPLVSRAAAAASRILTTAKLSQRAAELPQSHDDAPTLRAKLFEKCFELVQAEPSAIDVTAGALLALARSTLAHDSTGSLLELSWLSKQASSEARNRLAQEIGKGDLARFARLSIAATNRGDRWANGLVTPGVSESAPRIAIDRVREVALLHQGSWRPLALTDEQLGGHANLPLLPECRLRVRFAGSTDAETIDALVVCSRAGATLHLEMPSPMPGGYCAVLLSNRDNWLNVVAREGWTREQFARYANRWLGSNNIGSSSSTGTKAIAELLQQAVAPDPSSNGSAPPINTEQERDTALQKLLATTAARTRFEPAVPPEKEALLSALSNDNCKLLPITNEVLAELEFLAEACVDEPIAEWSKSTHSGAMYVITDSKGNAKLTSPPATPDKAPPRFLFVDQINYTIER